jgi:beta-lactam-binding protein with PASTA domain
VGTAFANPAPLAIPDVIGRHEEEAVSAAQAAGLHVRVIFHVQKGTRAGAVLSQTPAAGTMVSPGSTIVFVVARPPANATHQ